MPDGVRMDLLLLECVGVLIKTHVEPRLNNVPVWDGGLRQIAHEKLKEMGVSDKPVTAVDAARRAGLLKPDPNEIVIENKSRSRRAKRRV